MCGKAAGLSALGLPLAMRGGRSSYMAPNRYRLRRLHIQPANGLHHQSSNRQVGQTRGLWLTAYNTLTRTQPDTQQGDATHERQPHL